MKSGRVIRSHVEVLPVRLSPDELRDRGEKLAGLEGQYIEHKAETKAQSKTRKEEEGRLELSIYQLASHIREKCEPREIEVEVRIAGKGQVAEVRLDTGEIIRERPLREEEKQEEIPLSPRGDA